MLQRCILSMSFALGLLLAGACQDTDCRTACFDEEDDCLDNPSDYDGYAACAGSSSRTSCVHALCAAVHDRCTAQCHDDTSH